MGRCLGLPVLVALLATAAACAAQAAADPAMPPRVTVLAEQREEVTGSRAAHQFVPVDSVGEGRTIYYTVRIEHPGGPSLRDVEVTTPIPRNTRYVGGTAVLTGGEVTFSVDGRQFMPEVRLKDAQGVPLPATQYTHIRWRLPYALTPGVVVLARFQAVFH